MHIRLNLEPSPIDIRDYKAESIFPKVGEFPSEFSLIEGLQEVRNQGSQGTCLAQTVACMKEWQEKIDMGVDEYMSPQFVYNLRSNQSSEGMYPRDGMKILLNRGICLESQYAYGTFEPIPEEVIKSAKTYVIESYAAVATIDALKTALIKSGPCLLAVPVYDFGMRMWKQKEPLDLMLGGHAMTVVGYNKEGFIIRNSWGAEWGDRGYTIFPYEDWGMQWEVWSTIDKKSAEPIEPKDIKKSDKRKGFWEKVWDTIVSIFTI